MNFNAIQRATNVWLEDPIEGATTDKGPVMVKINGDNMNYNNGYAMDPNGTVDQHTADLACQAMGYVNAVQWYTASKF